MQTRVAERKHIAVQRAKAIRCIKTARSSARARNLDGSQCTHTRCEQRTNQTKPNSHAIEHKHSLDTRAVVSRECTRVNILYHHTFPRRVCREGKRKKKPQTHDKLDKMLGGRATKKRTHTREQTHSSGGAWANYAITHFLHFPSHFALVICTRPNTTRIVIIFRRTACATSHTGIVMTAMNGYAARTRGFFLCVRLCVYVVRCSAERLCNNKICLLA